HHENNRCKARNRADVDDRSEPGESGTSFFDCDENGMRDIQLSVVSEPSHHQRHENVEHSTDRQRSENSDWHVPLRILRLLCRRRYRIESYVGEEHDSRAAYDPAPAVMPVLTGARWNKGMPVRLVHVHEAETDNQ